MAPKAAATPHDGNRPSKSYRGSPRRVRRLTFKSNWSMEVWLLIAWVIFLLFVVVPWMLRHQH
jgi:hypothetical protein